MLVGDIEWVVTTPPGTENTLYTYYLVGNSGQERLTVLDRLTGYSCGIRDVESGYRDAVGTFWLASGGVDIRQYPELTVEEAIALVKRLANTCIGD